MSRMSPAEYEFKSFYIAPPAQQLTPGSFQRVSSTDRIGHGRSNAGGCEACGCWAQRSRLAMISRIPTAALEAMAPCGPSVTTVGHAACRWWRPARPGARYADLTGELLQKQHRSATDGAGTGRPR